MGMVTALAACSQLSATGIELRADRSLRITEPHERERVSVPFQLTWIDDRPEAGGSYAVFVNQPPMPPGSSVAWVARDDDVCRADPACPGEDYLHRRGVTVTAATTLMVDVVPREVGGRSTGYEEITVVRLRADGRRVNETSAFVRVRLEERDTL